MSSSLMARSPGLGAFTGSSATASWAARHVCSALGAVVKCPWQSMIMISPVAPDAGAYVVAAYSPSAADGTPQHEQDVPITVTP